MEYRRAYWDERPDPWLVERHEREITPLLHRRRALRARRRVPALRLRRRRRLGGGGRVRVLEPARRRPHADRLPQPATRRRPAGSANRCPTAPARRTGAVSCGSGPSEKASGSTTRTAGTSRCATRDRGWRRSMPPATSGARTQFDLPGTPVACSSAIRDVQEMPGGRGGGSQPTSAGAASQPRRRAAGSAAAARPRAHRSSPFRRSAPGPWPISKAADPTPMGPRSTKPRAAGGLVETRPQEQLPVPRGSTRRTRQNAWRPISRPGSPSRWGRPGPTLSPSPGCFSTGCRRRSASPRAGPQPGSTSGASAR